MRLALLLPLAGLADRMSPHRWSIGLALAALVMMAVAQGVQWHFAAALQRASTDLAQAQRQLRALDASPPATTATASVFVDRLPKSQDSSPALYRIQNAFTSAGAVVVTSTVSTEPASISTLGKQRILLTVKGPYTSIKAGLAEALARVPHVKLLNLTLRAPAAGAELDGQLELLALSRPLSPGSAASSL